MTRRFSLVAFVSFVFGIFVLGECAKAQTAQDKIWWQNLNWYNKNMNILHRALYYYPDGSKGGQCKVWVQNVVSAASKKVVWLPSNDSRCDWRWQASTQVQVVYTDRWDGVPWQAGQIMQAQVRYKNGSLGPHTMIITGVTSSRVSVIESNWAGDERVRRRTATWADFKRSIVHYTLYQVK